MCIVEQVNFVICSYDIATMENCFKKWVMGDTCNCLHMQWINEHTTKNMHSHTLLLVTIAIA